MSKRIRSARSRKYPKYPVVTLKNVQESKAFYEAMIDIAPLSSGQFAAGVIEHPTTKLHQVWFSTNGLDVTCLSAHCDEGRAEEDLRAVKALIGSADFYDDEKIMALFKKLHQESDEKPCALPDDLVRAIIREILRAVVDRP